MKQTARMAGALLLAALVGGCGERAGGRSGLGPMAPRLVGSTASVTVSCPTKMEYGTSGTCVAYGYDANGVFTNSNVTSWSSSNTSLATINSSGGVTAGSGTAGTVTITAVIDGISGSTTIRIVAPLSVTINGRNSVRSGAECYYWAAPTGGSSPFSYSWSQTWGTGHGDGADGYYATSSTSYTLYVTVTDANGTTAHASKAVTVSSNAPLCPV